MIRPTLNLWCILLLLGALPGTCAFPIHAEETRAIDEEAWSLLSMGGQPAPLGVSHERIWTEQRDGRTVHCTRTRMTMRMKRLSEALVIDTVSEQVEDARTGQIVYLKQNQKLSSQETVHEGHLSGDTFQVTITNYGQKKTMSVPWGPEIIGPVAQSRLHESAIRDGTREIRFKTFTFEFMKPATATVEFLGREPVAIQGTTRSLVKARSEVDLMPGIVITTWHDDRGAALKSIVPLGGNLVYERVSAEEGRRFLEQDDAATPELLIGLSAPSNVAIPRPYETTRAIYEISLREGASETLDLAGGSQRVTALEANRVLIHVSSLVPPDDLVRTDPARDPSLAEYLEANLQIQSDDPRIRAAAREAVGRETDPWKRAKLLERWVHRRIANKTLGVAFASAVEALETATGDCTEHAVLLAALGRALGIPSRVAVGLLYYEKSFAGHMWTEVNVGGVWFPLDATMARAVTDAARIRFDSASLKETGIADSFLSLGQALGNVRVHVREYAHGDRVGKEGADDLYVLDGDTWTSPILGLSLRKPAGWEFADLSTSMLTGRLLTLVPGGGTPGGKITVSTKNLAYNESFESLLAKETGKISLLRRRESSVQGRRVLTLDYTRKKLLLFDSRWLKTAIIDGDTVFFLSMEVKDERRDPSVFDRVLDSVEFRSRRDDLE